MKYPTSSNYVKKFRKEHGEPDVIEVRRTFTDKKRATDWESKVIRRIGMVKSDLWLNKKDPKGEFYNNGIVSFETKKKTGETMKTMRKDFPELWGNQKKTLIDLWQDDEYKSNQLNKRHQYWLNPINRQKRKTLQQEVQNREELKASHSEAMIEYWSKSENQQRKIELSEKMSGDNNPSKRLDVKKKQRQKALNRSKETCPYCGITCSVNVYARWHGDKCKNKE